jgi:hypothetical protein
VHTLLNAARTQQPVRPLASMAMAIRSFATQNAPANTKLVWDNPIPHPHWTDAQLKVEQTHVVPKTRSDSLAYRGVKVDELIHATTSTCLGSALLL